MIDLVPILRLDTNVIVSEVITMTKVPIVKLKYSIHDRIFDCNLSFNNELAVKNSQLLRMYSRIGPIVPIFAHVLKDWSNFSNRWIPGEGMSEETIHL